MYHLPLILSLPYEKRIYKSFSKDSESALAQSLDIMPLVNTAQSTKDRIIISFCSRTTNVQSSTYLNHGLTQLVVRLLETYILAMSSKEVSDTLYSTMIKVIGKEITNVMIESQNSQLCLSLLVKTISRQRRSIILSLTRTVPTSPYPVVKKLLFQSIIRKEYSNITRFQKWLNSIPLWLYI